MTYTLTVNTITNDFLPPVTPPPPVSKLLDDIKFLILLYGCRCVFYPQFVIVKLDMYMLASFITVSQNVDALKAHTRNVL